MPRRSDIDAKDACAILDDVNGAIARWARFAAEAGCTKKTARAIGSRLRRL